jgi:menaquinone-9 beta-reductase
MSERTDVFVIGGGPAGLGAAIAARQLGLSVIVADGSEPPIDKPCGEGLLPETQEALAELNVEIPSGMGFRLRGIRFVDEARQACAEFPRGKAIGIRRTELHELLIERARESGVKLLWKAPVMGIGRGGVRVGERTVAARWIVGADGRGSRVRRWSGLGGRMKGRTRFASRRHYRVKPWSEYTEIYWGRNAQAYVTPISAEEICVVLLAAQPNEAKFEESWAQWPVLERRLGKAEVASRERGAATSTHSLSKVFCRNVALVGDASGSVDAITGEGLRLAFRQGLALAVAMKCGDLAQYQREHRSLMRRPRWMGKALLLMGQNATVQRRAIRALATKPELFEQLLAIHVGEHTTAKMLGTGARLGWGLLAT